MSDIEAKLREMAERRAGELRSDTTLPDQVRTRIRVRRAGRTLGASLVAVGLAVGLFVGLRAGFAPNEKSPPRPLASDALSFVEGDYVTNGIGVHRPEGWTLFRLGGEVPSEDGSSVAWPILLLSNSYPGIVMAGNCSRVAEHLPPDGVMLYVEREVPSQVGQVTAGTAWPTALNLTESSEGSCGDGPYTTWSVDDQIFSAFALAGNQASTADLDELRQTFSGLDFSDAATQDVVHKYLADRTRDCQYTEDACRDVIEKTQLLYGQPELLVMRGDAGEYPWQLGVIQDPDGLVADPQPDVLVQRGDVGVVPNFETRGIGYMRYCLREDSPDLTAYGQSPAGSSVAIESEDGAVISIPTVGLPSDVGATFNVFAIDLTGVFDGTLVARDEAGKIIAQEPHAGTLSPVEDGFGNKIGNASICRSYPTPTQWLGNTPGWFYEDATHNLDGVRSLASTDLMDVIPEIQGWWDARPSADAPAVDLFDWWRAYPLQENLGDALGEPN